MRVPFDRFTGGDCDISSLNMSLSMSTWGRRFCRAFSIKLAIFQRNRCIPRTDLRFLPASSSNHNYKDGNENTEISLRSRRLEVAWVSGLPKGLGERLLGGSGHKKKRARQKETREGRGVTHPSRGAFVFSFFAVISYD